jgi:hypothetical protein
MRSPASRSALGTCTARTRLQDLPDFLRDLFFQLIPPIISR